MDEYIKELTNYNKSELKVKFADYTKNEIIDLLEKANIPYRKYESKKKLIEHTSREISSLGIYIRIGKNQN